MKRIATVITHLFSKDGLYWIINYAIRPLRRQGLISDEFYLKITFRCVMSERLNLDNPVSFNQKLQWLKLYDRKDIYASMVDKYAAKDWVKEKIGCKYIIPTLGTWKHYDDIDFTILPDKFVLKATHGSGNNDVIICKNKSSFNQAEAKSKLEKSLKNNCYLSTAEWVYKNICPMVIAETYLEDSQNPDLCDYKFMCFNGRVKCSFVCSRRGSKEGVHVTFFDRDWNKMPFERNHPSEQQKIDKPFCYEEMVALAEKLSAGMCFLRVDFYEIDKRVYFGELTFYPGSGFEKFQPRKWDDTLGSWIELPKK